MPTVGLKPQRDGFFRGWSSLTGGTSATEVLDDSDGSTHDGDTTKLVLPVNLIDVGPEGNRVSLVFFDGASGLRPTSITATIAAKRDTAAHPRIHVGFCQHGGGVASFHVDLISTGVNFAVFTRTFPTNPLGGQWATSNLQALEFCMENEDDVFGSNQVTLVSLQMTYTPLLNYDPLLPHAAGWR